MNYRHAYHAGSHADVLKHAVLTAVIEKLLDKPSPIFVLDTHAGIGAYDLGGVEPEKTGEWKAGIGAISETAVPAIDRYLAIVRAQNPDGKLKHYPGSPAVAAALLRPGDRLVLSELHPEDVEILRDWAAHLGSLAAVHRRDGYEALNAFLPPREGRGLIVVDPPYEQVDEFSRLAAAVIAGHRRWPGGRWLIWHPIKDRAPVWQLQDTLIAGGIGDLLSAELLVRPVDGVGLAGSGVLLVNPPFRIDEWLEAALPQLQAALAPEHGSHALRWLRKS